MTHVDKGLPRRHCDSAYAKAGLFGAGWWVPNLLVDDANLDTALLYSIFSCMTLAGQGCVLPTRLLVQRGVYAEVVERLSATAPLLKTGMAYDPTNVVGPVISQAACDRITGMIERARI